VLTGDGWRRFDDLTQGGDEGGGGEHAQGGEKLHQDPPAGGGVGPGHAHRRQEVGGVQGGEGGEKLKDHALHRLAAPHQPAALPAGSVNSK
jgi:hypothetical protein